MKLTNFIDGKWQDVGRTEYTPVFNPANGEQLAEVKLSTMEDVNIAVEAAVKAQKNGHSFLRRNVQIIYMRLVE